MALVTSCPHCDTSFRVVVDQLKLRSGKVRCGVCHEVFCALDRLRADQGAEEPQDAEQPAQAERSARFPTRDAVFDLEAASDAGAGAVGDTDDPSAGAGAPGDTGPSAGPGAGFDDYGAEDYAPERRLGPTGAEPGDDALAFEPRVDVTQAAQPIQAAQAASQPREAPETREAREAVGPAAIVDFPDSRGPYLALDELILDTPETADFPGPGPREQRGALAGRRPEDEGDEGWRTLLARHRRLQQVLAVLLALGLLLQAVVAGRDWLAARFPALEPLVAAVAAPFGLEIQLPRSLAALSIESFELRSSGAAGLLAASAILRNEARYAVRWPSMDLTLTDAEGQVLARRIIDSVDYLDGDSNPPLRGRSERRIRFALQTDGFEPAGYSVLLFYRR